VEVLLEAVGFTNNPMFTNEQAAAMAWSDEIVVMLLTHEFWKTFTDKTLPTRARPPGAAVPEPGQPRGGRCDRRHARRGRRPLGADPEPGLGFMYGRSFEDPDGHIWENVFMNMAEVPEHA
jgi:predicted lactoylglutathione lyase